MIPYFQFTKIPLGPITIQAWGLLVAMGLLFGTWVAARRAKSHGLDPKHIWDAAFWAFLSAFIGARIFHVLFYDLGHYLAHPLDAINPAEPGFSMIGGLLGAALACTVYIYRKKIDFFQFADAGIFGLPFGEAIGRLGCFVIHDHPGIECHGNPLCIIYPDGIPRHDHGLYASLLGAGLAITFLILGRRERRPGFFLALYMIIFSCIRFSLDFYRAIDARYFHLTPTQWLLIPLFILGVYLMLSSLKRREQSAE
ncbi:MAG: prolipoprotein diacylglyceryl transferase [Patescibacteria group bacterium]